MGITATVNLTTGKINLQPTDPELQRKFLGGRGLGAAYLYRLVPPEVKPFDPENCIIFASGPLNGTPWPTSSRYHVTFKSPATGAYGYANAGGHFGPELTRAGYDAVIVTGKAPAPVYLEIREGKISILPAEEFWGQPTSFTEETLRGRSGGRVAAIGQAGENLVRISAIINDGGRAAARTGPGAVMGSKNLKALQVIGSKKPPLTPEFSTLARNTSLYLTNHPDAKSLMEGSTLFLMSIKNLVGDLPARNHQSAQVAYIGNLDQKAFEQKWIKRKGCSACPMRCSRISKAVTAEGEIIIEGPEYETTDALGPMVNNSDPDVVIQANFLCNEYGLDTISTGVCIAFAMECHQRGILDNPDFTLEWGDPSSILGLIEAIALRKGLGDVLAEGVARAAEVIGKGADRFALHVKGVEMPRQEPRVSKAFGLGHATSNRGADHMYGLPGMDSAGLWDAARKIFPEEILPELMDSLDETYKPDLLEYGENFCAVVDSLGLCKFSTAQTYVVMVDEIAAGLRALGIPVSAGDLLQAGERIVNLERLYNIRHGFDSRLDKLPGRFIEEPLEVYEFTPAGEGKQAGRSETPVMIARINDFDAMLQRYYRLRGWDVDGKPTPDTLERLELIDYGI